VLAGSAREIAERMRASRLVTDVDTDYQVGMPEVRVIPDRDRAADLGVSMAAIGETVNAAIGVSGSASSRTPGDGSTSGRACWPPARAARGYLAPAGSHVER